MEKEKEECGRGEEGPDGTYGSPCNRRLRQRVRARGFRRSLCVSGVPEGASENEGSGRRMRSERKVVVCADDGGGAAGAGGWLVMVVVVVEANEQAGGQVGWMTRGGRGGKGVRWRKGAGKESREGTKGKRVQAGLGSDEGECVTVCIVGTLFSTGEDCLLPARLCLAFAFLVNLPAGRTAGRV